MGISLRIGAVVYPVEIKHIFFKTDSVYHTYNFNPNCSLHFLSSCTNFVLLIYFTPLCFVGCVLSMLSNYSVYKNVDLVRTMPFWNKTNNIKVFGSFYIFSSLLSCPLRFSCKNDVRLVFTHICFVGGSCYI